MTTALTDTQNYQDIADAIATRKGSAVSLTPSQMADEILALPSGGSGDGSGGGVKYTVGGFFGELDMNSRTSLQVTVKGQVGSLAAIVVCHRADVSLSDNGFSLRSKTANAANIQWVSVYTKTLSSTTSTTVTITQASSQRMSACVYYFEGGTTFGTPVSQPADTSASNDTYTISVDGPTLVVCNRYYDVTSSVTRVLSATQDFLPPHVGVLFASGSSAQQIRFFSFVTHPSVDDIVINFAFEKSNGNCLVKIPIIAQSSSGGDS